MSSKSRNGVMLLNIFFKIFLQFFKIRVECPLNGLSPTVKWLHVKTITDLYGVFNFFERINFET